MHALRARKLRVLPVLLSTPVWARMDSGSAAAPAVLSAPPQDPVEFADFAGAFAARYGGPDVAAYQIWDEPNLSSAWGNGLVNPTLYLQMLRAARAAIHASQPRAVIMLAALAPTVEISDVNLAPQIFLLKLYQLGGHQAFDIAAAKPYGFDAPPSDRRVDPAVLNFSHVILMREVMLAHGEGYKSIWAAQFGWNALPAGWTGESSPWGSVSEQQQADYTRGAVQRVAREWPWLGGMLLESYAPRLRAQDPARDARWGFAMIDPAARARPVFEAFVAALADAQGAARASLFADCRMPASLARTLRLENLITALPEVDASPPDCRGGNPAVDFSPGWRFDQLGADIPERPDARATIHFAGDALALIVRRGNYRAYTYVTVDGRPANLLPREPQATRGSGDADTARAYLIMTAPGLYPVIETIPVATGLGPGAHVAEITVERGWNQWALVGWSTHAAGQAQPGWMQGALLALAALCALACVLLARAARGPGLAHAAWHRVAGRATPAHAAGLAALLWLTSAMAWAQDAATAWRALGLPINLALSGLVSGVLFWSPALIVSLLTLAALAVLIMLRLEAGLMLLAFFIPFFLLPQRLFERSFPMVEILTALCFVSWLWRMVRTQAGPGAREPDGVLPPLRQEMSGAARGAAITRIHRSMHLLDWAVLAMAVAGLLSTLQAAQQIEAWRELRLVILEPAIFYLMLRSARLPAGSARLITGAFVSGAATVAGIGLFNYARGVRFAAEGGLPRIKSIYNSANNDALYLARVLPFALIGTWLGARPSWRARALRWAAVFVIGAALVLTQSRGMLLFGLPAMAVVMPWLRGGRMRWLGGALAVGMLLALAALASGALAPLLAGTRLANAFDLTGGTGFFRLNLWQSAWRMFLDHPLFGVGPDNFLYAYRSRYILPAAWQEPNLSHPHNVVLDWATRLGVLGLVAGGALVLGWVSRLRQALTTADRRALAIASAGTLAAILAHGMVDHSFFLVDLMFGAMLVAGLLGRDDA